MDSGRRRAAFGLAGEVEGRRLTELFAAGRLTLV
jgi:hypothetical protein